MAGTYYAFTNIFHGDGHDDQNNPRFIEFKAGEKIEGDVDQDTLKQWIEDGTVVKYNRLEVEAAGGDASAVAESMSAENDQLRRRIAELEGQVALKNEAKNTPENPKP